MAHIMILAGRLKKAQHDQKVMLELLKEANKTLERMIRDAAHIEPGLVELTQKKDEIQASHERGEISALDKEQLFKQAWRIEANLNEGLEYVRKAQDTKVQVEIALETLAARIDALKAEIAKEKGNVH